MPLPGKFCLNSWANDRTWDLKIKSPNCRYSKSIVKLVSFAVILWLHIWILFSKAKKCNCWDIDCLSKLELCWAEVLTALTDALNKRSINLLTLVVKVWFCATNGNCQWVCSGYSAWSDTKASLLKQFDECRDKAFKAILLLAIWIINWQRMFKVYKLCGHSKCSQEKVHRHAEHTGIINTDPMPGTLCNGWILITSWKKLPETLKKEIIFLFINFWQLQSVLFH